MAEATDTTTKTGPAGWVEALARSEADVAAGRTVPGEAVMSRVRRTIAEVEEAEARRAAGPGATARIR